MEWRDYSVKGDFETSIHQLEGLLPSLLFNPPPAVDDDALAQPRSDYNSIVVKNKDNTAFQVINVNGRRGTQPFLSFQDEITQLCELDDVQPGSVGQDREQQLQLLSGLRQFLLICPLASPFSTLSLGDSNHVGRSIARYRISLLHNALQHYVTFTKDNIATTASASTTPGEGTVSPARKASTPSPAAEGNESAAEPATPAAFEDLDAAPVVLASPSSSSAQMVPVLSSVHDASRGAAVGLCYDTHEGMDTCLHRLKVDTFNRLEGKPQMRRIRTLWDAYMRLAAAIPGHTEQRALARFSWTLPCVPPRFSARSGHVQPGMPVSMDTGVTRTLLNLIAQRLQATTAALRDRGGKACSTLRLPAAAATAVCPEELPVLWYAYEGGGPSKRALYGREIEEDGVVYTGCTLPLRSLCLRSTITEDGCVERIRSRHTDSAVTFRDALFHAQHVGLRAFFTPSSSCNRTRWYDAVMGCTSGVVVDNIISPWRAIVESDMQSVPYYVQGNVSSLGVNMLDVAVLYEALAGCEYEWVPTSSPLPDTPHHHPINTQAAMEAEYWRVVALLQASEEGTPLAGQHSLEALLLEQQAAVQSWLPQLEAIREAVRLLDVVHDPSVMQQRECMKGFTDALDVHLGDVPPLLLPSTIPARRSHLCQLLSQGIANTVRASGSFRFICRQAHHAQLSAGTQAENALGRLASFTLLLERTALLALVQSLWERVYASFRSSWDELSAHFDATSFWGVHVSEPLTLDWSTPALVQHIDVLQFVLAWATSVSGVDDGRSSEDCEGFVDAVSEEEGATPQALPHDNTAATSQETNEGGPGATAQSSICDPTVLIGSLLGRPTSHKGTLLRQPPDLIRIPPVPFDQAEQELSGLAALGMGITSLQVGEQINALRPPAGIITHTGGNGGAMHAIPQPQWFPSVVRSDMAAFKACNPQAHVCDFLRWYFPSAVECVALPTTSAPTASHMSDKINSTPQLVSQSAGMVVFAPALGGMRVCAQEASIDGEDASAPAGAQVVVLIHGSVEGNGEEGGAGRGEGRGEAAFQFWNALWQGSRPRPAHMQHGLFNPLLAAELSLSYLERCSMAEVCWALFQHNISHASNVAAAYIHAATSDAEQAHMYSNVVPCLNDALHGIADGNAAIRVLAAKDAIRPVPAPAPAPVPLRIDDDEEDSKDGVHEGIPITTPPGAVRREVLSSLHHASLRLHTTAVPLILDVYTYATRMLQLQCLFEATAEDAAAIKAGKVLAAKLCVPNNISDASPPWHGGWHINTDEPSHVTCTSPHELCVPDVDAEGDGSTFWSRLRAFASLRFMPLQAGRLKRAGGHSRGMPGGSMESDTGANMDENASISIPLLSAQRNYAQDALLRGRAYFMGAAAVPSVIQGTYPSLNGEETSESGFVARFPTPLLSAREAWTSPPISHKPRNVLEQSALVHILPEEDAASIQCVISSIAAFSPSHDSSSMSSPTSYLSSRSMWSTARSVLDELAPVPDSRIWIFRTERKNDETTLSMPFQGESTVLSPASSMPQVCFRFCAVIARDGSVALSQSSLATQDVDGMPEHSV